MTWRVTYWRDPHIVHVTSDDCELDVLPTSGVLRVWTSAQGQVSGHDHYWINPDLTVGTADHHDYDRADWRDAPRVPVKLPDCRVLDGVMVPDEVWGRL